MYIHIMCDFSTMILFLGGSWKTITFFTFFSYIFLLQVIDICAKITKFGTPIIFLGFYSVLSVGNIL